MIDLDVYVVVSNDSTMVDLIVAWWVGGKQSECSTADEDIGT
jgi:hypothetical protein